MRQTPHSPPSPTTTYRGGVTFVALRSLDRPAKRTRLIMSRRRRRRNNSNSIDPRGTSPTPRAQLRTVRLSGPPKDTSPRTRSGPQRLRGAESPSAPTRRTRIHNLGLLRRRRIPQTPRPTTRRPRQIRLRGAICDPSGVPLTYTALRQRIRRRHHPQRRLPHHYQHHPTRHTGKRETLPASAAASSDGNRRRTACIHNQYALEDATAHYRVAEASNARAASTPTTARHHASQTSDACSSGS